MKLDVLKNAGIKSAMVVGAVLGTALFSIPAFADVFPSSLYELLNGPHWNLDTVSLTKQSGSATEVAQLNIKFYSDNACATFVTNQATDDTRIPFRIESNTAFTLDAKFLYAYGNSVLNPDVDGIDITGVHSVAVGFFSSVGGTAANFTSACGTSPAGSTYCCVEVACSLPQGCTPVGGLPTETFTLDN